MADPTDKPKKGPEFIEDMMSSTDSQEAPSSRGNEQVKKMNLSDRFTIQTDSPLKDLSTATARAFEVRDGKQKQDVYALILQNSLPIRFKTVQQLRQFFSPNFTNIIDSGFTDVARGEFGTYSVILEKPRGTRLSEYLAGLKSTMGGDIKPPNKILLSEDFITTEIVAPINEVLKMFADNDISHGHLHHENVFLNPSVAGSLHLGECVAEPCGFSQPHQYEVVERAQSMPLGKGNSTIPNDYFALGVLVIYCIFGELPGRNTDMNEFIAQRLHKGSYNTYLGMLELPPQITDLLRGLLTDQAEERWGYEQVFNWLKGKKYNLIRPKLRKESIRDYEFAGISHNSKRQLAHTYFQNWDNAASDIRDRKISKWLELSVNDKAIAEHITSLVASTGGEKSRNRADDDELVAKALIILDPLSPIRYRNIAAHIDGIGAVLANAWLRQNQPEIQTFKEIIRLNLIDFKAVHESYAQKIDRWVLQRLQNYIKISSIGFGLERCLYDLNPSLPCQSPIMSSQFIVDINQLLYFLNDNATKLAGSDPVDRHVAAFLGSKLDITQEVKLKAMRYIKDEKVKAQLMKLALLAFAQRKSASTRLSGLANWMLNRSKIITEILHSRKLRKDIITEMKNQADAGNLEGMMHLFSNSDYFIRDHDGFGEAQRAYMIYDAQLKNIKMRQGLSMKANVQYQYGLYLSKIIGVVVFVLTLIITMSRNAV